MTREEVITVVLAARTPAECKRAQAVLAEYMAAHPDDLGVLQAGEQLYMVSTAK